MTKAIFIFIATLLLILPALPTLENLSIATQLMWCAPFILLLGIPHGAIDNVLYQKNHNIKNSHFIYLYLLVVAANVALWIFAPVVAYILFLVISAYHFGQSQVSHYFTNQPLIHRTLYLSWGLSVLSGLIYWNHIEITMLTNQFSDFSGFSPIHQKDFLFNLYCLSTANTAAIFIWLVYSKKIRFEHFVMEVLVLCLISLCFYITPLVVGFTLYFIILHSYKVLQEEYGFLYSDQTVRSVGGFIRMVLPLTLFSFAGIAFLFGLIFLNILSLSYGYCLLIVISSITLPHVVIMNKFYDLLFLKKYYDRAD
jgi:Brp/Blh family beta-carotene 15,15'-monooxygenase